MLKGCRVLLGVCGRVFVFCVFLVLVRDCSGVGFRGASLDMTEKAGLCEAFESLSVSVNMSTGMSVSMKVR